MISPNAQTGAVVGIGEKIATFPPSSMAPTIDAFRGQHTSNFEHCVDSAGPQRHRVSLLLYPEFPLRERSQQAQRLMRRGIVEQTLALGIGFGVTSAGQDVSPVSSF